MRKRVRETTDGGLGYNGKRGKREGRRVSEAGGVYSNKLVKGETIKIFNYGNCKRDFTYVDDIVEGVVRVMKKAPDKKNGEDGLPIPPYAVRTRRTCWTSCRF